LSPLIGKEKYVASTRWFELEATETVEKLSRVLETDHKRQGANAAVALLLQIVDQDIRALLIKRAENPTDSWSGHIALPGGKRDVKDRDLKETVAREVLEEIDINVLDYCRFLGVLLSQRSKRKPELNILPFVILLEKEPLIRVNEREVEKCIWVSLKELIQNKDKITLSFGDRPAYIVGKYRIWGLTYRILREFIYILTSQ
jgi:8-oxo-dGTP pyrophosphatase MutT (NUDIX family)